MAFVHVRIYERSIAEAASLMECSEKSVRNHLSLALNNLGVALGVQRRRTRQAPPPRGFSAKSHPRRNPYPLSMIVAMPCPTPMHMVLSA